MALKHKSTGGGGHGTASARTVEEFLLEHDDALTEVLIRLDIKSLCQCRCVCKAWKSAIADPSFDKLHLDRTSRRDYLLFEKIFEHKARLVIRYITAEYNEVDREIRATQLGGVIIHDKHWSLGSCLSHEGGLVCFLTQCKPIDVCLCNPHTSQTYGLPRDPFRSSPDSTRILITGLVFGYVCSMREYVVLIIGETPNKVESFRASKFCFASEGDSLHSASWKEIEQNCPYRVGEGGILVSTFAYWIARAACNPIISLDVENDKFGLIDYPPSWPVGPSIDSFARLIDLKEKLYLTDMFKYWRGVLELWVLVKSSECCWVKEYKINLDFPVTSVFSKSSSVGELIMVSQSLEDRSTKYYILNPYKESIRILNPIEDYDDKVIVGFFRKSFF